MSIFTCVYARTRARPCMSTCTRTAYIHTVHGDTHLYICIYARAYMYICTHGRQRAMAIMRVALPFVVGDGVCARFVRARARPSGDQARNSIRALARTENNKLDSFARALGRHAARRVILSARRLEQKNNDIEQLRADRFARGRRAAPPNLQTARRQSPAAR